MFRSEPQEKQALDRSYLEGCASLLGQIDKKVLIVLRDNRNIVGMLRSCDQFNNLVLFDSVEQIHLNKEYCEIPLGIFIVRGDNLQLVGEVNEDREIASKGQLKQIPAHIMLAKKREKEERDKVIEAKISEVAKRHGFPMRDD